MPQTPNVSKCIFGATAGFFQQDTFFTPNATIEYKRPGKSADTWLYGSFCPLVSGYYTLNFTGVVSIINPTWNHKSYFMQKEYEIPNVLHDQSLEKGMCYSFKIVSADQNYTYCTLSVQLNDNIPYIPNSTELISCQYDGYFNDFIFNNKHTCITKKKLDITPLIILTTKMVL